MSENVEDRAANMTLLESSDQGRLVDDLAASDVDDDGAGVEQGESFAADQTVRFSDERRRDHQYVAALQHFVQFTGARNAIDKFRFWLVHAPANADHSHAKCMRTPGNFLSGGAETNDGHPSPEDAPGPYISRQFILNPASFALRCKHQVESARKYKKAANNKLCHRRRLNSTGVGNQDSASGKFFQGQNSDRRRRGMDPSESRRVLDHRGGQTGCERDVRGFNCADRFGIGNRMHEVHLGKPFAQPLDL